MYKSHDERYRVGAIEDDAIFGYQLAGLTPLRINCSNQTLIQNIVTPHLCQSLDLCSYVIPPLRQLHKEGKHTAISAKSADFDRCLGALYGLAVGEALGTSLQGKEVIYDNQELQTEMQGTTCLVLKPGQWSAHTSQACCLADSLIYKQRFDPFDFLLRLSAWCYGGYNNAFRADRERKARTSCVGLRPAMRSSLNSFLRHGTPFRANQNNDNQSLVRLAPLAVWFAHYCTDRWTFDTDMAAAMQAAKYSSRCTQGDPEAAECCALLMMYLVRAMQTGDKETVLDELAVFFTSPSSSVHALARSEAEYKPILHPPLLPEVDVNKNWNWRAASYRYAARSSKPSGRYCCDTLAMALHCVDSTSNFADAVLKAANLGGDAEAVAGLTGAMAGALYGYSTIFPRWLSAISQWDEGLMSLRVSLLMDTSQKARQKKRFVA